LRSNVPRGQASISALSKELGINPKTVAKWRKQATIDDLKTGPGDPRSTVLTQPVEAAVVAFRRHTLLPLDDLSLCVATVDPTSVGWQGIA